VAEYDKGDDIGNKNSGLKSRHWANQRGERIAVSIKKSGEKALRPRELFGVITGRCKMKNTGGKKVLSVTKVTFERMTVSRPTPSRGKRPQDP